MEPKRWKMIKYTGSGIRIDTEKKEILHNPKKSWIRFESKTLIHLFYNDEKDMISILKSKADQFGESLTLGALIKILEKDQK